MYVLHILIHLHRFNNVSLVMKGLMTMIKLNDDKLANDEV